MSVNKEEKIEWEDIKHIVISLINDFYSNGKKFVFDKEIDSKEEKSNFADIEKKNYKYFRLKDKTCGC